MFKFKVIVLAVVHCILIFFCSSCRKENNDNVAKPDTSGTVTIPGTPDGTPVVEMTIGAEGGLLISNDGQCSISIPAGALENNTHFSIQRISNTNPLGRQSSYRILPHGINLAKPATISFRFSDSTIVGSNEKALGIAYQDPTGIWKAVGGLTLDAEKKTVSVATNHFSDWSLFDHLFLMPQHALVEPDNSLELEVFLDSDFLEPLVEGQEQAISGKVNSADKYIKSWTLSGPGLLSGNKAKATYKAPSESNADDVTVSVELDLGDKGQYILLSHIDIAYSGIKMSFKNGPEKNIKAHARQIGGVWMIIGGEDDGTEKIQMSWVGTTGFHAFAASATNAFVYIPDGIDRYVSMYTQEHVDVPSDGGITITKMSPTENYIEGNFDVHPTGKVLSTHVAVDGAASGTFKVKIQE